MCVRGCEDWHSILSAAEVGHASRAGPLATEETSQLRLHWERQAQKSGEVEKDRVALNLQLIQDGLLECRGRLQGGYPVYLPESSLYSQQIEEEAHLQTLHGGEGLTMTKVRSRHWIPKLRKLVKEVGRNCHGYKRFQAMANASPTPGYLPTTRTEGVNLVQVIGVDYAGPLRYRISRQREEKAYVLLYACSLTGGLFLDLLASLETEECLRSLKRFIERRARTERIYSDNSRIITGVAKWARAVTEDEPL